MSALRVLVAGEPGEARDQLARLLSQRSWQIIVADLEHAVAELRLAPFDAIVVAMPDSGGPEILHALGAGHTFVLCAIGADQSSRLIVSAFAAGAHDVLRAPYTPHELYERVDVATRLRRWLAARGITPAAPRNVLDGLRAWRYLGYVVADDLETMLGARLVIEDGWPRTEPELEVATIAMTLASEHLELSVSVGADAATTRWLAGHLLGDPDASPELVDDMLRELANMAGGALKRAVSFEGPVLGAGIPCRDPVRGRATTARCWTIALSADHTLVVIADVRQRGDRRIAARRLAEGMVVVDDVRTPAGVLLVASGTRLTATTAERLSMLLDSTLVVIAA